MPTTRDLDESDEQHAAQKGNPMKSYKIDEFAAIGILTIAGIVIVAILTDHQWLTDLAGLLGLK